MAKIETEQPKKKGVFSVLTKTFFDVPRWVNAKQYANVNKMLYAKIKDSFRIAKAQRVESFDAAMTRLHVTEQELQQRLSENQRALMILLIFIALMCFYGFYLIYINAIAGALMIFAVIVLSAVRGFQYSFWNFQIKNRVLGCSFKRWWHRDKTS